VAYYLGIDGGGTKTTCAVGDDEKVLATATSGPSNIVRVGEWQARESLHRCVEQACKAAGISNAQVSRVCVGGSGAARPELAAVVRNILSEILSSPVDVVGDMETALVSAFDDGPGVIVIAGTGSIAYGRDQQGRTLRAGGWGFAIGDEGSAHWIGREAVSAVLRANDRGNQGASLEATLYKAWGVRSLMDLARAANSVPPPDFSVLSRAVVANKDKISQTVLSRAGKELAELAHVILRRLFGEGDAMVPVAMTGGVFRHSEFVREVFYNELRRLDSRANIRGEMIEPVEGALRMARRAAHM
jgi:glucosamine kinase